MEREPTEASRIAADFRRPEASKYCIYSNRPVSYPKNKAKLGKLSLTGG
ncbi:hypothetical protein [Paenibacillus sacheonensis]|uniref:Uncharacterized protein n=1 Tax=Paenibacillus sacheonensis TaxID=742054 RepID=A0A7X4YR46_9BACL|nr:hypothetical protein [Paenibacillus sacheonensis]MBM7567111.1 hypothetical protein [Paenibacillus sacheonensis]NBC70960.1 hypothetical protein [Paenibacillus sacheonensis]